MKLKLGQMLTSDLGLPGLQGLARVSLYASWEGALFLLPCWSGLKAAAGTGTFPLLQDSVTQGLQGRIFVCKWR